MIELETSKIISLSELRKRTGRLFGVIHKSRLIKYNNQVGYLVWDYAAYNELSFIDCELAKITSLEIGLDDFETGELFNKLYKKHYYQPNEMYLPVPRLNNQLEAGDVIGVDRLGFVYEHYGVYLGHGKVMHYVEDGIFSSKEVRRTSLKEFIKDSKQFFIIDFYMLNQKLDVDDRFLNFYNKQTVKNAENARTTYHESDYNLINNNCEHFAFWCKTGRNESIQFLSFDKSYKIYLDSHPF